MQQLANNPIPETKHNCGSGQRHVQMSLIIGLSADCRHQFVPLLRSPQGFWFLLGLESSWIQAVLFVETNFQNDYPYTGVYQKQMDMIYASLGSLGSAAASAISAMG